MELLLLVFFCLLTGSEVTFGAEKTFITVDEGRDVTLPCSLREDITNKKFEWKKDDQKQVFLYDDKDHSNNVNTGQDQQFKGRVSYFLHELKSGNASITISNIKVDDSGVYTCEFPDLQQSQIFYVQLIVVDGNILDPIIPEPTVTVKEGRDVTLPCSLREDITNKKFVWKKDGRQVFLYDAGDHSNNAGTGQDQQFKERVEYFPDKLKSGDASITIRDMKVDDSGVYTCEFPDLQPRQIFYVKLVSEPEVIRLKEGSDVILPCSLNTEDITNKKFVWKKDGRQVFLYDDGSHSNNVNTQQDQQFRGRVSHFLDELKSGNASITISNTRVADSGVYTCEFPDLQPRQIFQMKLLIVSVASPHPCVRKLEQTDEMAELLQCEVRGAFPKPELHWQDRAGNKLPAEEPQESERGGLYDIILRTTVTKTDKYRCVVTQKEINHQTHAYIEVIFPERTPGDIAAIVIGLVVVVLLVAVAVLAVLIRMGYITIKFNKEREGQKEINHQAHADIPVDIPDEGDVDGTSSPLMPLNGNQPTNENS